MSELWRKVVTSSAAQAYSLLMGMAILTITARWLGPEGRGEIAAVTTWVGLFSVLCYLSLGQVAIYRATRLRGLLWLGPTLGSLAVLAVLATFLGWSVAWGLYVLSHGAVFGGLPPLFLAAGFLALPLAICEQYSGALLMAVDRVEIYTRGVVIGRTIGVLLVILAWRLELSVVGVLGAILVSQGVVAFSGMRFLLRRAWATMRPDVSTMKDLLKDAVKLHPNYVGGFLMTSCSVLIVNHYLGAVDTGQYQAAQQLVSVLLIVPQGALMVMYGQVAQLGPVQAWASQRSMIVILILIVLGEAVVAAILAPWAVPLLLGSKFGPCVGLLQTLLLGAVGMILATAMTPQWIGRGLLGQVSLVTIGLGVLSVAANLVLVPRYRAYGAAWASVTAYALAAGVQGWLILKCESGFKAASWPAYERS